MKSELFDTHVHLPRLDDAETAIAEAAEAGVTNLLAPSVDPSEWPVLARFAASGIAVAGGIHPLAVTGRSLHELQGLPEQLPRMIAVGETGLDGSPGMPSRDLQEELFRAHIRLARTLALPLILHCRKGFDRLFRILREEGGLPRGGVLHGFSGSHETAREAIAAGLCLGIGSVLTRPGNKLAQRLLDLDPEMLVLETDAPDMHPHPESGIPNRPANLVLIAKALAQLKGWDDETCARITTNNARRLFGTNLSRKETP